MSLDGLIHGDGLTDTEFEDSVDSGPSAGSSTVHGDDDGEPLPESTRRAHNRWHKVSIGTGMLKCVLNDEAGWKLWPEGWCCMAVADSKTGNLTGSFEVNRDAIFQKYSKEGYEAADIKPDYLLFKDVMKGPQWEEHEENGEMLIAMRHDRAMAEKKLAEAALDFFAAAGTTSLVILADYHGVVTLVSPTEKSTDKAAGVGVGVPAAFHPNIMFEPEQRNRELEETVRPLKNQLQTLHQQYSNLRATASNPIPQGYAKYLAEQIIREEARHQQPPVNSRSTATISPGATSGDGGQSSDTLPGVDVGRFTSLPGTNGRALRDGDNQVGDPSRRSLSGSPSGSAGPAMNLIPNPPMRSTASCAEGTREAPMRVRDSSPMMKPTARSAPCYNSSYGKVMKCGRAAYVEDADEDEEGDDVSQIRPTHFSGRYAGMRDRHRNRSPVMMSGEARVRKARAEVSRLLGRTPSVPAKSTKSPWNPDRRLLPFANRCASECRAKGYTGCTYECFGLATTGASASNKRGAAPDWTMPSLKCMCMNLLASQERNWDANSSDGSYMTAEADTQRGKSAKGSPHPRCSSVDSSTCQDESTCSFDHGTGDPLPHSPAIASYHDGSDKSGVTQDIYPWSDDDDDDAWAAIQRSKEAREAKKAKIGAAKTRALASLSNQPPARPNSSSISPHSPVHTPVPPTRQPHQPPYKRARGFYPTSPSFSPSTPKYSPVSSSRQPRQPQQNSRYKSVYSNSPTSPSFSPTSPNYTPTSPTYSPESPRSQRIPGSPTSPKYTPKLPGFSPSSPNPTIRAPGRSPTSPMFSPTSPFEKSDPPMPPERSPTSLMYSPTSPAGGYSMSPTIEGTPLYRYSPTSPTCSLTPPTTFARVSSPRNSPFSPMYLPNSPAALNASGEARKQAVLPREAARRLSSMDIQSQVAAVLEKYNQKHSAKIATPSPQPSIAGEKYQSTTNKPAASAVSPTPKTFPRCASMDELDRRLGQDEADRRAKVVAPQIQVQQAAFPAHFRPYHPIAPKFLSSSALASAGFTDPHNVQGPLDRMFGSNAKYGHALTFDPRRPGMGWGGLPPLPGYPPHWQHAFQSATWTPEGDVRDWHNGGDYSQRSSTVDEHLRPIAVRGKNGKEVEGLMPVPQATTSSRVVQDQARNWQNGGDYFSSPYTEEEYTAKVIAKSQRLPVYDPFKKKVNDPFAVDDRFEKEVEEVEQLRPVPYGTPWRPESPRTPYGNTPKDVALGRAGLGEVPDRDSWGSGGVTPIPMSLGQSNKEKDSGDAWLAGGRTPRPDELNLSKKVNCRDAWAGGRPPPWN